MCDLDVIWDWGEVAGGALSEDLYRRCCAFYMRTKEAMLRVQALKLEWRDTKEAGPRDGNAGKGRDGRGTGQGQRRQWVIFL